MRWNIKRTKLLFALIPIISIAFYILTANNDTYADQSFVAFDIYQQISDTYTPADNTSPADYTAAENFAIANKIYMNTDCVQSTTSGTVVAMGFYKQTVLNYRAKRNGQIFSESVSLSAIASVAEQRYFKDGALLYRKGEASGGAVKSWSEKVVELSSPVYRQRYGVVPQEVTKYSVRSGNTPQDITQNASNDNSGSIKSGSLVSANDDGTFTYELIMDPTKAYEYSVYEMMTYAGVTAFPDFISCRLVFTIDSNWRMLEVQSYDSYKISLMGGTKCDSKLSEVYTYDDDYMPERAQIFIDYVPTGNTGNLTTENGPADYLNEAFGDYISGSKTLCLNASVDLLGSATEIQAALDIAKGDYRFALGSDIFAAYYDDTLYLTLGDNKYSLSASDLSALGVNSELSISDDMLDKLFANYEITETDTHMHIVLPFEMFGFDIKADLALLKTESGLTADAIKATIGYGIISTDADVNIVPSVTLPAIDEKEFISLKPAIDAVANTIKLDAYELSGGLNVSFDNKPVSADFKMRLIKRDGGIELEGDVSVYGLTVPVKYVDDAFYLKIGDTGIRASAAEFDELIKAVTDFGGFDTSLDFVKILGILGEIVPQILPADLGIDAVLDLLPLICYEEGVLNVNVVPIAGNPWSLTATHDDIVRSLAVEGLTVKGVTVNADIKLNEGSDEKVASENPEKFISASSLTAFLPAVKELLRAESYEFTLNGSANIDKLISDLNGKITINRNPFALKADINTADGIGAEITVSGGIAYIKAGNFACKLALKETNGIINALGYPVPDSLNAALELINKLYKDGEFTFDEVINSLTLGCDNGALTAGLTFGGASLTIGADNRGNLSAHIAALDESVDVSLDAKLACSQKAADIVVDNSVTYTDLATLVSFIKPVKNTAASQKITLSVTGSVATGDEIENISATVNISRLNGLKVSGSVFVSEAKVEFAYLGDTIYLRIYPQSSGASGEISVKLGLADAKKLMSQSGELLGSAETFVNNIASLIGEKKAQKIVSAIGFITPLLENGKSSAISMLGFKPQDFTFEGITSILSSMKIENGKITLPVLCENGNGYNAIITADADYITGATVGAEIGGVALDLNAAISYEDFSDITVNGGDYVDLYTISALLPAVNELLNANTYGIQITDGLLNSSVISGKISGEAEFSLNPLKVKAHIVFRELHSINLLVENRTVYVAINDIKVMFALDTIDELKAEINRFKDQFGISLTDANTIGDILEGTLDTVSIIEKALGGKTIGDILSYVTLLSESENGGLTAGISYGKFSLTATIAATIDNALNINVTNFNYDLDVYDSYLNIKLGPVSGFTSSDFDNAEYLAGFVDIAELSDYITPVLNTANAHSFALTFAGNVNYNASYDKTATENANATFIEGKTEIALTEGFADIYLNIVLGGKTGNQNIKLWIIDETDYETSVFDKNNLTAYLDYNGLYVKINTEAALVIVGAMCDILNLDIPQINKLTAGAYNRGDYDVTVFKTMDIAGLDKLRDTITSIFDVAEDGMGVANNGIMSIFGYLSDDMFDKILTGLSLGIDRNGYLYVNIDNGMFDEKNLGNIARVTLGHDDSYISYVDINNLVANGDTVNFNSAVACNTIENITALKDGTPLDFSSMGKLLTDVINTASEREFQMGGNIDVDILSGILNLTIQMDAKVKILDNGNTVAAVCFNVPRSSEGLVGGAASLFGYSVTKTDSYIYFADNMLYFVVDVYDGSNYSYTEMKSATVDEFLHNVTDYVFFLIRMSDSLKNEIMKAVNSGLTIDIDKIMQNPADVLKNYSYGGNEYALTLGLQTLLNSSDFSDVNLTIGTADNYITNLSVKTTLVSVVKIDLTASVNNYALTEGKITGINPTADTSFGQNKAFESYPLTKRIDTIDRDLMWLFPAEAVNVFTDMSGRKTAEAEKKAAEIEEAELNIENCNKAIEKAQNELDAAVEKLESLNEGSFGYERAYNEMQQADKELKRAVRDLETAQAQYDDAVKDKEQASKEALEYAHKALEAAKIYADNYLKASKSAAADNQSKAASAIETAKNAKNQVVFPRTKVKDAANGLTAYCDKAATAANGLASFVPLLSDCLPRLIAYCNNDAQVSAAMKSMLSDCYSTIDEIAATLAQTNSDVHACAVQLYQDAKDLGNKGLNFADSSHTDAMNAATNTQNYATAMSASIAETINGAKASLQNLINSL